MNLYGIVGAGGFGREVIPLARMMLDLQVPANYELVFVDEVPQVDYINHYRVLSVEDFFAQPANNKFFNVSIAHYQARRKMVELMLEKGAQAFRIDALNRIELDDNHIAEGAIFCSYTTVTSNAKIGKYFHANIYSYVAHDCRIGDYVTFAPNVHCNGNVIIEDNVYVGTGVVIKQGTKDKPLVIGEGAVIGMGAVVTKNVEPYATVVGNPARPLQKLAVATAGGN